MTREGFILAEDEALKAKLVGVQIPDQKEAFKDVPVRFRNPQPERARVEMPFITIDLVGVARAPEREHSLQYLQLPYTPSTASDTVVGYMPTPVDITYQVTTHCRSALQDRHLTGQLFQSQRIPLRWGWLYVPADDTDREMELLNHRPANYLDEKRMTVYRQVFTLSVTAEMTVGTYAEVQQVLSVHLDDYNDDEGLLVGINT